MVGREESCREVRTGRHHQANHLTQPLDSAASQVDAIHFRSASSDDGSGSSFSAVLDQHSLLKDLSASFAESSSVLSLCSTSHVRLLNKWKRRREMMAVLDGKRVNK